ncbi:MAG: SMP-30/gluconolactonase/LRE family protein [Flavobacteriales bacterium]
MKSIFTLAIAAIFPFYSVAQNLSVVESVEYDEVSGRFLASNSSSIIEVDGNGDEVAYFGSATAGYGMEVMNGVLFAISTNRIKGYNLGDASTLMDLQIPGVSFLNGMASDGVSRLWVTDFSLKKIYEIDVTDLNNPVYSTVVNNTVSTPNGIVYDGDNNRLVFVNWGMSASIKQVDLSDYSVSVVTTTTLGNCDGIDKDNNGNYFVSSWSPNRITKFSSEFSVSEIITAPGISSPADICYATTIDTLAIPNSGNSTITFVGFNNITNMEEPNERSFGFTVSPNPVSNSSVLNLQLEKSGNGTIEFYSLDGKLVSSFFKGHIDAGLNRILLYNHGLATGQYLCVLTVDGIVSSEKIVVE